MACPLESLITAEAQMCQLAEMLQCFAVGRLCRSMERQSLRHVHEQEGLNGLFTYVERTQVIPKPVPSDSVGS